MGSLIERKKRIMMMQKSVLDTSPKIAEYEVYWNRTIGGKANDSNWCITKWYTMEPALTGSFALIGYIGEDLTNHTFQYHDVPITWRDWYYFNNGNQEGRRAINVGEKEVNEISFSIYQPIIDDSYVYLEGSGIIIFAGKNSIYYGHRNISELS